MRVFDITGYEAIDYKLEFKADIYCYYIIYTEGIDDWFISNYIKENYKKVKDDERYYWYDFGYNTWYNNCYL